MMRDKNFILGLFLGMAITLATMWITREVTDTIVKLQILKNERSKKI